MDFNVINNKRKRQMLFHWKCLSTAKLESRHSDTWMHVHEGLGLLLQKRWKLTHKSGRDGVKILHVTWTCQSEVKSYYSKASNNTSNTNYSESYSRQKRNVPLEVIIVPMNMKQNNSDEKSPPNMCMCPTHTHTFIFIIFLLLSKICLVSGAVLLFQSETPTAYYAKQLLLWSNLLSSLLVYSLCMIYSLPFNEQMTALEVHSIFHESHSVFVTSFQRETNRPALTAVTTEPVNTRGGDSHSLRTTFICMSCLMF